MKKSRIENERNTKKSDIEWTYTDSIRPLLRKQQGAVVHNGQNLFRRLESGFSVDQLVVFLVCAEHRKCASKSSRAWVESSRKSGAKLCADQSVSDSFYAKRKIDQLRKC